MPSPDGYFRQIVCSCWEPGGTVLVDGLLGCASCDLILPYYLMTCKLCRNKFVKVFKIPGFGDRLPICWDCFPQFNIGYRPTGVIIPPPSWAFPPDPAALDKVLEELSEMNLDFNF